MQGGLGPRFALEAGFLVVLAVVAGVARLSPTAIVLVMGGAWLLVSLIELAAWREGPRLPTFRRNPMTRAEASTPPPPPVAPPDAVEAAVPERRRFWRRRSTGAEEPSAEPTTSRHLRRLPPEPVTAEAAGESGRDDGEAGG